MKEISGSLLKSLKKDLESHPVYAAVRTLDDLKLFMQHHVYSVWDFMSLVKYLQFAVAPASYPWVPVGDGNIRRFINDLVLEEESDLTTVDGTYSSHFELYLAAMDEIGADTTAPRQFIRDVIASGVDHALANNPLPEASRVFTRQTFAFIDSDKPHVVASALTFGREHIVPLMFREILSQSGVSAEDAPIFNFYLERHIQLDEGSHGPLALRLLNGLCKGDVEKIDEAIDAAETSIQSRMKLWDGVLQNLQKGNVKAA